MMRGGLWGLSLSGLVGSARGQMGRLVLMGVWLMLLAHGGLDMRRSAAIAALMMTTAFTPTKANAMPQVIPFLQGFGAALLGTSAVFGGSVTTAGFLTGLASAGTVTGSFLGRALLSIGLSSLVNALTPRVQQPTPAARLVNYAQPVSYAEWPFGRVRKGGPFAYSKWGAAADVVTGRSGNKRHVGVILAACPIDGIETHYLDEREVLLDANGTVETAPMTGYYRIRPFFGGAVADPELLSQFPSEFTISHDFEGLSGAHIWGAKPSQERFSEVYPNGRLGAYAPVIRGNNQIYDPRDGQTKYTNNAALVIAYWATVILGREVDWAEVATEADACDEVVINAEGGQQARWQIDGVISDDQEFEDQRAQLAAACDAWFYEPGNGKMGFKVGRYVDPTVTLVSDDFFACEAREGGWGKDAPSEVAVKYVEPANKYREATSGAWVIDATERQKRSEPEAYMIASHNQAARMAKRIARTMRPDVSIRGTVGIIGYWLQGQRFIRIENDALGVSGVFEVGELRRNDDGFTFDIVANSVTAEDFDFVAALEEPARPVFNHTVEADVVPVPTGFTATASTGRAILATWTPQGDEYVQQIELVKTGDTEGFKQRSESGDNQMIVQGLGDGDTYSVRLRNLTVSSRPSEWTDAQSVTVLENTVAPGALTAFSVSGGPDVLVEFGAPNDANYFATRIYRADYAPAYAGPYDFIDASLVRTEYGIANSADSWTDTGVPAGVHAYWAVPINSSGVTGPLSGPETITTT